jgi:excinuclease UvrABC ATPase subunit
LVVFWNEPEIGLSSDDEADEPRFDQATITWPSTEGETPAFRLQGVTMTLPKNGFTLICGSLGSGKSLFVSLTLT